MKNILIWNCRGARKKTTGNYLRHLVTDHEVEFIGLVETKVEIFSRLDIDKLVGRHWEFIQQPANGKSGGILLLWKSNSMSFSVLSQMEQCIIGLLTNSNGASWGIATVYGHKDPYQRRLLWNLIEVHITAATPWVVGGDFNCILSQDEKKGGKPFSNSRGALEFYEFMHSNDLHDLNCSGPKFTWTNNKQGNSKIWVRLDRMLLNSAATNIFPLARTKHLNRIASDHCPLLLIADDYNHPRGNRWIKFEDIWLSYPTCWKIVKSKWDKTDFGNNAEILDRKCKRTLKALFHWSRNMLKELGTKKLLLEKEICHLQTTECSSGGLSPEQEKLMCNKVIELNSILARISGWWRQRAKARWITEGDTNSHFFHSVASGRRRTNHIANIRINGMDIDDPVIIQREFMHFFINKWQKSDATLLNWPIFAAGPAIEQHNAHLLCAEISMEEVWAAVRSMGTNRSPGLDGITSSFIKNFWEIVKNEFFSAIQDFFATGLMPEHWKHTLIVLIPKIENACTPSNFRPISLCQSVYKIVAKILVNRLKGMLPRLISDEQAAFVPRRSISNHCLLAQEIINKFKHSTSLEGFMALKIDMEQAYDRMNWDALQQVMTLMKFPPQFINWITNCVTMPKFSLLINGEHTQWIEAGCGFRQGCPLSPYLFILCSELLSMAFHQRGEHLGVAISNGGTTVSHLLYADDILIASRASLSAARAITTIVNNYCSWTGQRINIAKSSVMFSKSTKAYKANRIARSLGYHKVQEFDYLGIKLTCRALRCSDFSNITQKIKQRITAWGNRHLSLAGKATLIRSSILSMPMYLMTHTTIPKGIMHMIQKLCRCFLWQKEIGKQGLHYVAWKDLCQPLAAGGLGFHASEQWQGPLRARLAWDFFQNPDSTLHRCLKEKYGSRIWQAETKRGDSTTRIILKDGGNCLSHNVRWVIGSGSEIDILEHRWILDRPIMSWPTFVCIESTLNKKVADLLHHDRSWNHEQLGLCFGPELINLILATPTSLQQDDRLELIQQLSGRTITSLVYTNLFPNANAHHRLIKKLQLHPREQLFWWRIFRDALPTNTWLFHRHISDSDNCIWGCNDKEDIQHIISNCLCLRSVRSFLQKWGFSIPLFQHMEDLTNAISATDRHHISPIRAYCYAVYQCWRARNAKKHNKPYGTPATMAAYILEVLTNKPTFQLQEQWDNHQPNRLYSSLHWHPPPPGWLKANVDGTLLQSHTAGIGVTIRDCTGKLMLAAGRQFLHWDSSQVELQAIIFVGHIMEAWMYEVKGIIIEGDNKNILDFIKASMEGNYWKAHPPISPDIAFLHRFHQVIFQHVLREANKAADYCASFALYESFVWKELNSHNLLFFGLLDEDRRSV